MSTSEHKRLQAHLNRQTNWKEWGPYLSERAWGTVREDYSPDGTAWDYFPHDHARSRAYRWNEDGLMGISDRQQYLCFALALWNGQDPILKERLFGLAGPEGNHAEDVKEYYYYLDSTPTHSYMRMLYKYPQRAYPYAELVNENAKRGRQEPEYELLDTQAFADNRYFDVSLEYAKANETDILIQITATNHGPDSAPLWLLPTLWFRNTWTWGYENGPMNDVPEPPRMAALDAQSIQANHPALGDYHLYIEDSAAQLLFTENNTNAQRVFGLENANPYVKDAFHDYVIANQQSAVNPAQTGTKAAALHKLEVPAQASVTIKLRLSAAPVAKPFAKFDTLFARAKTDADAFYDSLQTDVATAEEKSIQRQAWAGMLFTKQLFYFDVNQWLDGDPGTAAPENRKQGRNRDWRHLTNFDIISMPDKWEYPWYAAWDLAFHCIPLAQVDPQFAKRQLILMTREWYMHPNGQLPAYEWAFGDVNPPVHGWAAWEVYQLEAKMTGTPDREFLEAIFHKLLLNFTWWINRKDKDDNNIFQGGFLGLDNISLFDRSSALPTGGHIDQSDGTAWMGFYTLGLLQMALELAKDNPIYQDLATKFYEHFLQIADAMSGRHTESNGLWDEEDGFFYDVLHIGNREVPLKVRSLVGLMPLIAVGVLGADQLEEMDVFQRRMTWFNANRPHLTGNMASTEVPGVGKRRLLSIVTPERLRSVLRYMLDEAEFLSPYGIRSMSKIHREPYTLWHEGKSFSIAYEPAESQTSLFGGNSNWRGPIWFPINYLLIKALETHYLYYGDDFTVECPVGSGNMLTLQAVAVELAQRLIKLFTQDSDGKRAAFGDVETMQTDPNWQDHILFYEYFNGDTGAGLGASHQTGWTGLVAELIKTYGAK